MSSDSIPCQALTGRVYRVAHEDRYTVVSNAIFSDSRLSLDALGILCFLLSQPDDWYVNPLVLVSRFGLCEKKIKTALQCLAECGYYKKTRGRFLSNGRFAWHTDVFESPQVAGMPLPARTRPKKARVPRSRPIPYPEPVTEQEEDRGIDSLLEFVEANGL